MEEGKHQLQSCPDNKRQINLYPMFEQIQSQSILHTKRRNLSLNLHDLPLTEYHTWMQLICNLQLECLSSYSYSHNLTVLFDSKSHNLPSLQVDYLIKYQLYKSNLLAQYIP